MVEQAVSSDGIKPFAISFAEKMVASDGFKALFSEGMGLVEATASYLDSDGRKESRDLQRGAALAYASESISASEIATAPEMLALLPARLNELIQQSVRLQSRIVKLDQLLRLEESHSLKQTAEHENPVAQQLSMLQHALARGLR
jgi:regulator of CtrA degradation